jgi:hypothetical protein
LDTVSIPGRTRDGKPGEKSGLNFTRRPVRRLRELAMRRRSVVTTIALGSTVLGAGALGAAVTAGEAEARLDVYIDKSAQRLSVIKNGALLYIWPVSTGRDQHATPNGVYMPERLERSWFSKAYYNSPMPHAIFFHNGYAIHGSYDITRLGGPASHGCVRLHPDNAALLYSMVEREGPDGTAIFVGGDSTIATAVPPPRSRPSLQYRMVEVPAQPVLRRDDGAARNVYPPEPSPRSSPEHYADAYPPPPMAHYYRGYVDGRGGPNAAPYFEAERRQDLGRQDLGRQDPGRPDDGRSAPRGPRVGTYYGDTDPYADGRGAPPRSAYAPYDYNAARYADGHGAPYDPRVPSDYADPYIDGRGAPRDTRVPPSDYRFDRYADGRGAPYGRPLPPDYDPYLEGRGAPQGPVPQPYYVPGRHDARTSDRPADRYGEQSGDGRTVEPSGPRVTPYATVDRHVDGPDRRHGDNADQSAMHGHAPANRAPASRADGNAAGERTPRHGLQPLTASASPDPRANPAAGAGGNPGARPEARPETRPETRLGNNPGTNPGANPGARLGPNHGARTGAATGAADDPPVRHPAASPAAARAPAPAQQPAAAPARPAARIEPERTQPEAGYRVLPPSYWAGASWRWRMKRDDDGPSEQR